MTVLAAVPDTPAGPARALHQALAGLRNATTLPALLERACAEVCVHLDAERCWLARVDADALVIAAVHIQRPEAGEAARRSLVGRRMRIAPGAPESEALRRRQTLIVDAHTVVAPLVVDERVVGLLGARYDGRPLGDDERDALAAFAQGLAFAAGRLALLERLRAQRRCVTEMAVAAQAITTELCTTPVDPLSHDTDTFAVVTGAVSVTAAPEGEVRPLLSRREREVVELLATGATNAAIADRLCLSEDTVKTHVRRILRKLRASNRAEAVSRYLRYG